jgi:UDP-N-acetylglucosamine transferase subunit ALG13
LEEGRVRPVLIRGLEVRGFMMEEMRMLIWNWSIVIKYRSREVIPQRKRINIRIIVVKEESS